MVFKVLGSVIYCIIDKHVCLYYLCLQHNKLKLNDKAFKDSNFDDISVIGITEVFTNIMYCHGLKKIEDNGHPDVT